MFNFYKYLLVVMFLVENLTTSNCMFHMIPKDAIHSNLELEVKNFKTNSRLIGKKEIKSDDTFLESNGYEEEPSEENDFSSSLNTFLANNESKRSSKQATRFDLRRMCRDSLKSKSMVLFNTYKCHMINYKEKSRYGK